MKWVDNMNTTLWLFMAFLTFLLFLLFKLVVVIFKLVTGCFG